MAAVNPRHHARPCLGVSPPALPWSTALSFASGLDAGPFKVKAPHQGPAALTPSLCFLMSMYITTRIIGIVAIALIREVQVPKLRMD